MEHPGRSAGALDSFKCQRLLFLFCSGAFTVIRIPRGRVAQSHRATNNGRAVAEAVARVKIGAIYNLVQYKRGSPLCHRRRHHACMSAKTSAADVADDDAVHGARS